MSFGPGDNPTLFVHPRSMGLGKSEAIEMLLAETGIVSVADQSMGSRL